LDEEDVARILRQVREQNEPELFIWIRREFCPCCPLARKAIDEQDMACLQGRFMSRQGEK